MIYNIKDAKYKKKSYSKDELYSLVLSMMDMVEDTNTVLGDLRKQVGEEYKELTVKELKQLKISANKLNNSIDNILKNNIV